MANERERIWSANDLEAHVVAILVVNLTRQFLNFTDDWHEEVCFKVLAPWITATKRSKPAPVSMFLCAIPTHYEVQLGRVKLWQNDVPDFDVTSFRYLLQGGEYRCFLGQRLLHGQRRFLYQVQRVQHRFPEVIFDWNQVTWSLYFNPAVVRIFIVWIVGHVQVYQPENQTIQDLSKAHKPKWWLHHGSNLRLRSSPTFQTVDVRAFPTFSISLRIAFALVIRDFSG